MDPMLLFEQMSMYNLQRNLVNISNNLMGMTSHAAETGNEVFILRGTKVAFALRKMQSRLYRLIGKAYAHGYMSGAVFISDGKK
jgi:hypothetical protein